jgi:hypothetical protein
MKNITALFYALTAVLSINESVLKWFFVVMAFDMVLGSFKSILLTDLKFNAKVFFFGLMRKLTLVFLVLFVATLGIGLGYVDMKSITTIVMRIFMLSEAISVLYNVKSIMTGKESKAEDFISLFIEGAIKFLGRKLEELSKVLNDKNSCL